MSRRRLIGESLQEETERAFKRAHELVADRGRGAETPELLLARALVRVGERLTKRDGAAPPVVEQKTVFLAPTPQVNAELEQLRAQLGDAREKIRDMMRLAAARERLNEEAVELALALLEKPGERLSARPDLIRRLRELSGDV